MLLGDTSQVSTRLVRGRKAASRVHNHACRNSLRGVDRLTVGVSLLQHSLRGVDRLPVWVSLLGHSLCEVDRLPVGVSLLGHGLHGVDGFPVGVSLLGHRRTLLVIH